MVGMFPVSCLFKKRGFDYFSTILMRPGVKKSQKITGWRSKTGQIGPKKPFRSIEKVDFLRSKIFVHQSIRLGQPWGELFHLTLQRFQLTWLNHLKSCPGELLTYREWWKWIKLSKSTKLNTKFIQWPILRPILAQKLVPKSASFLKRTLKKKKDMTPQKN